MRVSCHDVYICLLGNIHVWSMGTSFVGFYAFICVGVVLCGVWRGKAIMIWTGFIGSDNKGRGGNMIPGFTEFHTQETRDKSIPK